MPSISPYKLAFACYIYGPMSSADKSYQEFLKATESTPDLTKENHQVALVRWLNKWGCRQFAKDDYESACRKMRHWYKEYSASLPAPGKTLLELSEDDLDKVCTAYAKLAEQTASKRNSNRGEITVKVGPTGAAKILFALRPHTLIPWDESIRTEFNLDGSAASYIAFLGRVKAMLNQLEEACKRNHRTLSNLPQLMGKPADYSLVKIVDEYFWVTITKKCQVPEPEAFEQWLRWN